MPSASDWSRLRVTPQLVCFDRGCVQDEERGRCKRERFEQKTLYPCQLRGPRGHDDYITDANGSSTNSTGSYIASQEAAACVNEHEVVIRNEGRLASSM